MAASARTLSEAGAAFFYFADRGQGPHHQVRRRTMADENETTDGNDMTQEELEQQAQQAVEDGRAMQKITQLLQDNYEQREQLRELRSKLPSNDDVVLGPDEQEALRELGALGEDGTLQAGQVQERLQEAEEAQEELQAYRRRERRREASSLSPSAS